MSTELQRRDAERQLVLRHCGRARSRLRARNVGCRWQDYAAGDLRYPGRTAVDLAAQVRNLSDNILRALPDGSLDRDSVRRLVRLTVLRELRERKRQGAMSYVVVRAAELHAFWYSMRAAACGAGTSSLARFR